MRKGFALLGLVGALAFVSVGVAAAASTPPVSLSGPTNVHGKKDVSASAKAKLELEQDDSYFSPTFVKVQPGEQLTITLKNEGTTAHTFTSSALHVDKTVQPDKTAKVRVTIPATGGPFEFHCNFHQSMGMHGAFYLATAATVTTTPTDAAATSPVTDPPVTPVTPAESAPAQSGAQTSPPAAAVEPDPPPTNPPATTPKPEPNPPADPPKNNPGGGGSAF
jgi:plastocyanin